MESSKASNPIMQYFAYEHLPIDLMPTSRRVSELAYFLNAIVPEGPEKSAGMRKLLEAKDCFVRASIR